MNMIDEMYSKEIQLSRELMRTIEQELQSFGQVIPHSVHQAYLRLYEHYQSEIESGIQ
jgi:hypothetical protein